jgi:hypothetical protein
MRKFLTPALESFQDPTPLGDANISMEEEAIMLDEAATDAAAVDQDLNEAERVVQVADALEDLATVAGSSEELSGKEGALLETAGNMAVAGTDVDPEEVVPAMESFKEGDVISGKLAMEDFKEKARTMWENIKRMLKEIWEKITNFFYKIFGTIPRLRRSLESLRGKIEEAQRKTKGEAKFSAGASRYMFVGTTAIKTAAGLESGLDDVLKAAEYVYGGYVDGLKTAGNSISKALEEFDPEKPAEATGKLAGEISKHSVKVPGSSSAGGSRFPKYNVSKGSDLMGGVSLFGLSPKESDKAGVFHTLELARQASVVLEQSGEKAPAVSGSIEFQTLDLNAMEKLISTSEKILEKMENYQRGKAKKEIQEIKSKIEAASSKAEAAAGKLKGGSGEEQAAVPHYRALINFNLAYARWVQTPTIPFTKVAFGAIRTSMTLIERSLAQYK